jgi:glucose/arabinose dehydrogenase
MQRTPRAAGSVRIAALVALCALAASACGSTTPTGSPASGSATPSASAASSLAPAVTATVPSSAAAPSTIATPGSPGSVRIDLRTVARGFDQPVFVAGPADGSGRLFVVEQPGRIRIVRDGKVLPAPFLDIADKVSCCGEQGLLGLALAPGFGRTSGAFFVDYTDRNGDTVIARGTAGANGASNTAAGSVQTVLQIGQPFANHNGGMLAFGPDGDLYIGMGDGGSGGDPRGNGQRLGTLLGKIVRIDVMSDPGSDRYVVPPTNPFVANPDAKPEIWAFGMRNPWRFSFDRANGDLWIGDVGQDQVEEIDVGRAADGGGAGLNYGWNRMEGTRCFKSILGCDQAGLTAPFTEYAHGSGDCAIIGGYVYRGNAIPGLQGTYLFADECSGTIRAVVAAGPSGQEPVVLLESRRAISSFGEDEVGELYLTDLASGDLLQVVRASP